MNLKNIKILLVSGLLLCAALFIYITGFGNTSEKSTLVEEVSSIYPEYSIQDLVKYSDIIATGEIIEITKPFEIKPVNGGDSSLFMDYVIKLNGVMKNETNFEDTVNLRIRGGETEELIVVESDMPKLTKDAEYLFFLTVPKTGGGYTTKDDHVLLTGGEQGLLNLTATNEVYKSESFNTINQKDIVTMVNDPKLKKTNEELDPLYGLKENLKSGFITQEEYDETVKDLSKYAEIIKQK